MGTGSRLRVTARALLTVVVQLALAGHALAQQTAAGALSAPLHQLGQAAAVPERLRTKFIIGLERRVEFEVFSLTNPNRVFVELPNIKLQFPTLSGEMPRGLVKAFRGGVSAPGKARIVIDVTGPVIVEAALIETASDGSAQLAITIAEAPRVEPVRVADAKHGLPFDGASALGAQGLQPPMPKPAIPPQLRAQGAYKPVIVLDPGHGGDDTGATKNGTVEKDIVLAFSLKLRDKLNATGRYKVLMTRESDTFVELEERRRFAERNTAALFVAVHADYARASAHGATIYSLREGMADALQRSARGEVAEAVVHTKDPLVRSATNDDVGAVK